MIREIVKDQFFLQQKARPAEEKDIAAARDLAETLLSKRQYCAGLAANMIGERAAFIAVMTGNECAMLLNPSILEKSGSYTAEEGCLSLSGTRRTVRYEKIRVRYQDLSMKWHEKTFRGFTAEVIQHEIDHLHGILI